MSLDFELISLSKTPARAEVTAREMPENLHLHTCEGGFSFFVWLVASSANFQSIRKCSRIITDVHESAMLELYKIYSEGERNRSCQWKLFLEEQAYITALVET